jgi:hypothetical protein
LLEDFKKEHLSMLEAKERELESLQQKYSQVLSNSEELEKKLGELATINATKEAELRSARELLDDKINSLEVLEKQLQQAKESSSQSSQREIEELRHYVGVALLFR